MYVVSCRKGFDSDRLLGAENRYRNFTNPTDPTAFADLTLTELLGRAKDKHVCVIVHGFNNRMDSVMKAYWAIVDKLSSTGVMVAPGPGGYGLAIGFTWPGFTTAPGFFAARITSKRAGPFLLDLMNHLRGVAHSVDVQTHSLGARVALTALKNPKKVFVDNLLMAAAAVDHHLLEPGQDFFEAMESCNRCLVYHSKKDSALFSFKLADIGDGIHGALGRGGPRSKPVTIATTKNVYVVDCTAKIGSDHGGYRKTNAYFDHWKQVLSGGPLNRYDELS